MTVKVFSYMADEHHVGRLKLKPGMNHLENLTDKQKEKLTTLGFVVIDLDKLPSNLGCIVDENKPQDEASNNNENNESVDGIDLHIEFEPEFIKDFDRINSLKPFTAFSEISKTEDKEVLKLLGKKAKYPSVSDRALKRLESLQNK